MPAPLTVIIPTLNSAATLGPTLASLFEAVEAGLINQLILADGGSDDGTDVLADDLGATWVTSSAGRGIQLASGADAAETDWLLFLHSDTVLSDGWAEVVHNHIAASKKAGYFRLAFDTGGFAPRLVANWANLRSRLLGLPYGDQGLLITCRLYRSVGGYPAIPLMEDVALARSLRRQLCELPATATTGAARYVRDGWFRRGRRNLVTLLLYFLGRSPENLARRYHNLR